MTNNIKYILSKKIKIIIGLKDWGKKIQNLLLIEKRENLILFIFILNYLRNNTFFIQKGWSLLRLPIFFL